MQKEMKMQPENINKIYKKSAYCINQKVLLPAMFESQKKKNVNE